MFTKVVAITEKNGRASVSKLWCTDEEQKNIYCSEKQ